MNLPPVWSAMSGLPPPMALNCMPGTSHPVPVGAILISHGNGGNLSFGLASRVSLQRRLKRSILIYDYPGYGKSEGKPSEAGCYAAGEAGYRWLLEEEKFPSEKVILMGESLGEGVAVDLAARYEHQALVLLYTFTTLPAAAKYHYPFLPCRWLMANRFDNLAKIGNCHRPLFMIHGTKDRTVQFEQGEELFAAANSPKQFLRLEGYGHNLELEDSMLDDLQRFLGEK